MDNNEKIFEDIQNDDNRKRNRHDYEKNILCFKCSNTGIHTVKIPFIFKINNISYGGIGISCSQLLPKGSILSFSLNEDYKSRVFEIEVKWVKFNGEEYLIGTQFLNIVKDDIIFLYNVIKDIE